MTDTKELLTLAAKACGYYVRGWIGDRIGVDFGNVDRGKWNPLESGDDLARMESQLRITVRWFIPTGHQPQVAASHPDVDVWQIKTIADHPTPHDARAMASLRCAAEIGRAMK
jgi:hypothetical protein